MSFASAAAGYGGGGAPSPAPPPPLPPQQQQHGTNNDADAQQQHNQHQPTEKQRRADEFRRRTADMYERVADRPLTVASVHVNDSAPAGADGAPPLLRTKIDVVDRELGPVYAARSLREVHEALEGAVERLRQLEAFRRIDALIDEGPPGDPSACTVQLDLAERGWYSGGVQTFMQANEGLVQANLQLRNLLGAADQWRLSGEYGHRSSFDFAALFRLPRARGGDWTPDVSVFRRSTNLEAYSSFADTLRGLEVGATSVDGATRVACGCGWRTLSAAPRACREVAAQRGDFLADFIRVTRVFDERDSPVIHSEGWGARLAAEVGGLMPGAAYTYAKQRADYVWAAPLAGGQAALNITLSGGLIWTLKGPGGAGAGAGGGGARAPSYLGDRFYIGGVDSVRGFTYRGLGPSRERRGAESSSGNGNGSSGNGSGGGAAAPAPPGPPPERDALGGDVFASAYAGIIAPLPGGLGDAGGAAHVFVNGGTAALLSGAPAPAPAPAPALVAADGGPALLTFQPASGLSAAGAQLSQLASSFRWAAGFGLVLPTPMGRFEANYVWALSAQPGDVPKAGLQFGFAASPIAPAGPV